MALHCYVCAASVTREHFVDAEGGECIECGRVSCADHGTQCECAEWTCVECSITDAGDNVFCHACGKKLLLPEEVGP